MISRLPWTFSSRRRHWTRAHWRPVQKASVEREIARRDFNSAMTAGYAALDEGRFDEAERQFKAAQRILPGATEPETALAQTRTARTRHR